MMFDAIIIGGGPAGCAVGIRLAQNGFKTAILEKARFPRHKVCGEFFSPGSAAIWKQLGIHEKLSAQMLKIETGHVHFPGQKPFTLDLRTSQGPAFCLSRFSYDHLLLKFAAETGCEIFHETEALKITETAGECKVKTSSGEITANTIIVAAGRDHRFQTKKPGGKIGFKRHFKSPNPPTGLELYFFSGGYLGLVPVEKGSFNLCGILKHASFKKYAGNFDNLLANACKLHTQLSARVSKAKTLTPWFSCVTSKGFKGKNTKRVLWAGDSAYFLEPMIGQGMAVAAACGILAADVLIKGKDGKFYENECKKLLAGKQKILNVLDPLSAVAAKAPKFSRVASKLFLRPSIIKKILMTPAY